MQIANGKRGLVLVEQEVSLDLGGAHVPLERAELAGKLARHLVRGQLGIEVLKHAIGLILGGVAHVALVVDATRADERGVQPLGIVGCHEEQPAVGRRHAVHGVQQTAERQRREAHIGCRIYLVNSKK